jgi:type I restriction enzyme R subunit
MESGKAFRDYITEYQSEAKNDQIYHIAQIFGIDETKLRRMMNVGVTEANINEYGRFDQLKETVDKTKAKEYFERLEGKNIASLQINIKIHTHLQRFIISGGIGS